MKKHTIKLLLLAFLMAPSIKHFAQTKIYPVTGGELLFQWADISFNDAYMAANPNDKLEDNPLRFTMFLHMGQYVNFDFTDFIGLYTGGALRNVGLISNERLEINGNMEDYKIIRRSYTLGIPLALKLGSFRNHFYFFGGGEYEWTFVYKEKYWNSHSRSGGKTKRTDWFPNQTTTFMPSVFAGIQFPGGINVKFKYYLDDFLNTDYDVSDNEIFDLTRYEKSQMMYISVSWQIRTESIFGSNYNKDEKVVKL